MNAILIEKIRDALLDTFPSDAEKEVDLFIREGIFDHIPQSSETPDDITVIDGRDCVAIPGLVNTHHHFYQVLTRAVPRMADAELFEWLIGHYRIWEWITEEDVYWSSLAAMCELLHTGCTLTTDHHYVFPVHTSEKLIDAQIKAAQDIGIRFVATRGSMSLGKSRGGLPPDTVVQPEKTIIEDSIRLIERYHDPSPDAMIKIALAPCSPFSVSEDLMKQTAELAREYGVRLHTHLAETLDEEKYCLDRYGCRPVQLMERYNWIGPDVWFAHCVHLTSEEIELFARAGVAVAHCPSSNMRLGSGIAPVREMIAAGVTVGLAVDGSASNDASDMLGEVRQALLLQRVTKGASAMSVLKAFDLAVDGGARTLGYKHLGKLKPSYPADVALFKTDTIDYAGVHDPIGGLLLTGDGHRAHTVIVNGRIVIENGRLKTMNEEEINRNARRCARKLMQKAMSETGIDYLSA